MRAPRPVLIVPYVWIGDFVRCHSVVQAAAGAGPRAPGRHGLEQPVRAARRLHARRAPGDRRRPAAAAARGRPAAGAGRQAARGPLRPGADHVAQMEGGAGALPGRHSGAHRLFRRGPPRPDQRPAAGRAQAAAHDRPDGRAGAAQGRRAARRMAPARAEGAGGRNSTPGARGRAWPPKAGPSSPCRRARSAPARPGRRATMPPWRGRWPRTAWRSGCWAGRARAESPGRSPPPALTCAISPATTCATPSWPWPRPMPRSPTIPA